MATDGVVQFVARDSAHGDELWRSDGTSTGTTLVADLWPGEVGSRPMPLGAVAGGTMFFTADTPGLSSNLFSDDGFGAGPELVKRYTPTDPLEWDAPYPFRFAASGTSAFFWGHHGETLEYVWATDGTTAGTVRVGGPWSTQQSSRHQLVLGDALLYDADVSGCGRELQKAILP